ncbi:MAG: hypothetical protein F7C08_02145 [Desulfurococcales archaeon]|nr:hypothetical protein [Desulfurococcales archaeon]MCE4605319.1 hypothetical protein [Desulfurococcales archaeon]
MRPAVVYAVLLLLMYVPPYTMLKASSPLTLLLYWVTLGLAGISYAWVVTRRWTRSG